MIAADITRASGRTVRESCTLWQCSLCDSFVWINSDLYFSTAACPLCRSIDLLFCGRSEGAADDSCNND